MNSGSKIKLVLFLFSFYLLCQTQEQAVPDEQNITNKLFEAAQKGDFQTVKNLLTKYPDKKNARRNGGWTPLHSQAYGGHKDGVELLLDHGADIEAKHAYDMTSHINSIRWNRTAEARLLVEKGPNIDAANTLGWTPLIISATKDYHELAKIFLDSNADIGIKDNDYQRTALHFASLNGHLNIVAELLKKGADVDEKDAAGKTPLDYANKYSAGLVFGWKRTDW